MTKKHKTWEPLGVKKECPPPDRVYLFELLRKMLRPPKK